LSSKLSRSLISIRPTHCSERRPISAQSCWSSECGGWGDSRAFGRAVSPYGFSTGPGSRSCSFPVVQEGQLDATGDVLPTTTAGLPATLRILDDGPESLSWALP